MSDLHISFAGVSFRNPVVLNSGTCGFGEEVSHFFPLSAIGGLCLKALTLLPRLGNKPPRVAEAPSGMVNSVGLQNPGVEAFLRETLPWLQKQDTRLIANISGSCAEDYAKLAAMLDDTAVDMLEVNVSCPNVKAGGMAFGTDPAMTEQITAAVKENARRLPVIVKLSPAVTSIARITKAAQNGGADALSLINTLPAMRIDVRTHRPVLANNTGGLSGPCVLPVAVRAVYEAAQSTGLPILGMGGVSSGKDAAELMLAGASLIGVGTALLKDPEAPVKIVRELNELADEQHLEQVSQLVGAVRLW